MVMQEFISHRAEVERGLAGKLERNMQRVVLLVERTAKEDCPVDTGRLRASINSRVEVGHSEVVGIVGTNVEYAPYVEFGTSKMAAQPFLFPAVEQNRGTIEELLAND